MSETAGLRARKKERTRQAISDAAIALFLSDGFDEVSVADIAAAAEVSKPTLFRYFPTKDDLVLDRFADHLGELARVVDGRGPGETPLAALHRHFQAGLDGRDPTTGLCDHPQVLAFHRLVFETPSLASRLAGLGADEIEALTTALRTATAEGSDGMRPRLVAIQVVAVRQALARANWALLAAGRSADEVHPQATADAADAFALLSRGAAGLGY
jgi:AcrR family transcriptional regulator